MKEGEDIRIGSRALDLLIALVERAGDVVSRHELIDIVWQDTVVEEATVRVHISALRRALDDGRNGARYIVNIAGRGYSFVAAVTHDVPAAPPAQRRLAGQAPTLYRSIIGRERVIGSLSELLLERRFVSIVGTGGIGKTTVAAAVAERLKPEFDGQNVVFVDFGAIADPALVPDAVISSVGCTLAGNAPVDELLAFIANLHMLIIFDSCEHLLEATAFLAGQMFKRAPNIHLLVTSRESLRIEGETVHLLSTLACPVNDAPTAAEAMASPAVQLFMDRAISSGLHEPLTDSDAPIVSDICRRTDGIALAIELAASRAGTYGIRGIANLLASNIELRLAGLRNVVPRHRTLEAMLDWSFRLLGDCEQRVLCRLSALVGLFTIEAAGFVADIEGEGEGSVAATIADLVDKSLVWVQPQGDVVFYRLPDTTRAYARAKLDEYGDADEIDLRHALYFAKLLEDISLEHGAYAEIRRHAPHIGNVRKALDWCFSHGEYRATGVELAADSVPLFLGLWLLSECRSWSSLALNTDTGKSRSPRREVRLLEALAVSTMHTLGNTQEVRDAIERGLNLSEENGGGLAQLRLLAGLNLFLTRLGDFEGALVAAKKCAVVAERDGTLSERVVAEWLLSAAYQLAGDQATALVHCERGFELEVGIGHLELNLFGYDHRLRAELGRARVGWLRGSPARACRFALEAMERAEQSPLPGDYTMAAAHGIPVLLWNGSLVEAGEHIERLIAHTQRHSFSSHLAAALALKGEWLLVTGDPSAGVEVLRQAVQMLAREQFHMLIPGASRALAEGLAQCGSHDEARAVIDAAISSARKMDQKFWLPDLLRAQGNIIRMAPEADAAAAEAALRQSITHAAAQSALGWQLKAAIPLARLLLDLGRKDDASAILIPVFDAFPEHAGSSDLAEAARMIATMTA
ncbi:ATP-binding protein [Martelella soudanensis]|uniref:ATP-binding protein n=1 Tax=Martelella sp. NC20 TaxID=2740298 RepID=UPI0015DE7BD2|nr:winged helix-turn-helix domain-containing protein [Martelella sp. NC20]